MPEQAIFVINVTLGFMLLQLIPRHHPIKNKAVFQPFFGQIQPRMLDDVV
jgi:hypothetical protein